MTYHMPGQWCLHCLPPPPPPSGTGVFYYRISILCSRSLTCLVTVIIITPKSIKLLIIGIYCNHHHQTVSQQAFQGIPYTHYCNFSIIVCRAHILVLLYAVHTRKARHSACDRDGCIPCTQTTTLFKSITSVWVVPCCTYLVVSVPCCTLLYLPCCICSSLVPAEERCPR